MPPLPSRRDTLRYGGGFLATVAGCKMLKKSSASSQESPGGHGANSSKGIQILLPTPHQQASRLRYGAGRLGHLRRDSLAIWDTKTWTLQRTLPLDAPTGFGTLSDGSLVVADGPLRPKSPRVYVLPPGDASPQVYQEYFPAYQYIFQGLDSQTMILVESRGPSSAVLYQLGPDKSFTRQGSVQIPSDAHQAITSLGPGAVGYIDYGTIVKLTFPANQQSFPLPKSISKVYDVAPGPQLGQVWVSDNEARVHLLALSTPVRILCTIPFEPRERSVVYNLAAFGAHAAAINVTRTSPSKAKTIPWDWELAVYRPDGSARWRQPLGQDKTGTERTLSVGPNFVAVAKFEWMTEKDELQVWDLETWKQRLP